MAAGEIPAPQASDKDDVPKSMEFEFGVEPEPEPEPEIERLKKELTAAVRAEQETSKRMSKRNVAHAKEVVGSKREIATLTADKVALESDLAAEQAGRAKEQTAAAAEAASLSATIETIKADRERELTAAIEAHDAELASHKDSHAIALAAEQEARAAELSKERADRAAELAAEQAARAAELAAEMHARAEELAAEKAAREAQVADLMATIATLQDDQESLSAVADAELAKNSASVNRARVAEEQVVELTEEVKKLKTEHSKSTRNMTASNDTTLEKLRAEHADALRVHSQEKDVAMEETSTAMRRAELAESNLTKVQETVDTLRAEVNKLANDLSAALDDTSTVMRRADTAEGRLAKAESTVQTLSASNDKLAGDLGALRANHAETLRSTSQNIEKAVRESGGLKEKSSVAEKELEHALARVQELEGSVESLQKKEADRRKSQEAGDKTLAKQLRASQEETRALEAQLGTANRLVTPVMKEVQATPQSRSDKSSPPPSSAKTAKKQADASPPTSAKKQKKAESTRVAKLMFDHFDRDGDGYHNLKESQAYGLAVTGEDVSESAYIGMCKDIGASAKRGVDLGHFTEIYTDRSFGADEEKDYTKIFGQAPPSAR